MGNDFEARKRAKKRKSTDVDPELASEGGKKARKKRAAVRRLCKGMCYNEPSCTSAPSCRKVLVCRTDDQFLASNMTAAKNIGIYHDKQLSD